MSTLFSARRRALSLAVAAAVAFGSLVGGSSAAFADPAPTGITQHGPSTITGDPRVGQTVTATPVTWDADATLSYQWLIDGAPVTGADEQTYTPVASDASHELTVDTTGTTADATQTDTSDAVEVLPRISTATPTISGSAVVFSKLKVAPGDWAPSATTLSYRWYRGSSPISGATKTSYTLTPSDAGKQIRVHVAGHLGSYSSASQTSAAVVPKLAAFSRIPATRITGSATVTKVLTANHGTWPYSGVTFTYRWYKNGTAIPGATKSSLQLPISTAGTKVTVVVKGSKPGYASLSKRSASVTPKLLTFTSAPKPTISGTAQAGKTVHATIGTWSPAPTTKSYRWYRNGAAISGATGTSYTLTSSDVGKEIRIAVKATKSGYSDSRQVSAAIVPVKAPVAPAPPAASPAPGPVKVYKNCAALHVDYPHGVARAGTTFDLRSGRHAAIYAGTVFSTAIYDANPGRDADHDGIACEAP